jgi:hypothetical protein
VGETLTAGAEAENLGSWSIALEEGWKDNTLESSIAQFLEAHRLGAPSLAFAAPAVNLDASPIPEDLVRLGLLSAVKRDGKPGVHVWP